MVGIIKSILLGVSVSLYTQVFAQEITFSDNRSTDKLISYEWFATTQVGISIPNEAFGAFSDYGLRTMTGVELQQSDGLFFRAGYEITLLSFKTSRIENGYTIINKGSRSVFGGYIDAGFRFKWRRTDLYFFAGFGPMVLNSPVTTLESNGLIISTEAKSQLKGAFHGGLGLSYVVKPKLILFIEAQYFSLSGRTIVSNTLLDGINLSFGFKVPIRKKN